MPTWLKTVLVMAAALAMIPFALIAKARSSRSPEPRIHIIRDMDNQPRYEHQAANPLFADGRAMRAPLPGTIARGELRTDDHLWRGVAEGEWAKTFPAAVPVTAELMARGRRQYDIYCGVCHGAAGYGDGMIHTRAEALQAAGTPGMTWVKPTSLQDPTIVERPVGYLYHVATHGIRNMPGYGEQTTAQDRWAIVAYVRALQRSQNPKPGDGE